MSKSEDAKPTWIDARGGGGTVGIEGTMIAYNWMGKGYRPSVRVGAPEFEVEDEDTRDVPSAKLAAIAFTKRLLEQERARIDRVLAALDDIRDEPPVPARPIRKGRTR
jgi:hypothetical protein